MRSSLLFLAFTAVTSTVALPAMSPDAVEKREANVDEIADSLYGGWPDDEKKAKRTANVDEIADSLYGGWPDDEKKAKRTANVDEIADSLYGGWPVDEKK